MNMGDMESGPIQFISESWTSKLRGFAAQEFRSLVVTFFYYLAGFMERLLSSFYKG